MSQSTSKSQVRPIGDLVLQSRQGRKTCSRSPVGFAVPVPLKTPAPYPDTGVRS